MYAGLIPGLVQWVKDLALLQAVVQVADWLRSGVSVALVQAGGYRSDWTPTWEPPHASNEALERTKRQKKKKKEEEEMTKNL